MNKSKLSSRIEACKEGQIEIGAEMGRSGPSKWYVRISDNNDSLILKPTPDIMVPSLANRIRGVENYWNLKSHKDKGQKLPDYETIAQFWIDIVKSAYENDLYIHAYVAYIPPLPFDVKGLKVEPKKWSNPIEDEIIVQYSNFWVGTYSTGQYPNKPIFRLSSYDVYRFGWMSAKSATEYIDLHPIEDKDIILKLFKNAEMIYLPDIKTIANLRIISK